nr:hypothetical protein Iba_chr12aCG7010 [Ipomoea batatas]
MDYSVSLSWNDVSGAFSSREMQSSSCLLGSQAEHECSMKYLRRALTSSGSSPGVVVIHMIRTRILTFAGLEIFQLAIGLEAEEVEAVSDMDSGDFWWSSRYFWVME